MITKHQLQFPGVVAALLSLLAVGCGEDARPATTAGAGGLSFSGSGVAASGGFGVAGTAGTPPATGGLGAAGAVPTGVAGLAASGAGRAGGIDAGTQTNGAACPVAAPASGSLCTTMGFVQCQYATGPCQCLSGTWQCGTSDPQPQPGDDPACPDMPPETGDSCDTDGTMCNYRRGNDCECVGAQWACDGAPDPVGNQDSDGGAGEPTGMCPAQAPADGSDCAEPAGTRCDYGQTSCACWGGGWRC